MVTMSIKASRIRLLPLAILACFWAGHASAAPDCNQNHYAGTLPVTTQNTGTTADLNGPTHLDAIDEHEANSDGTDCKYHYAYTGQGVDVYVLDSGIPRTAAVLQELPGLQLESFDAFPSSPIVDGYGASVAAVIAGRNAGVAKNAKIYSVRVRNNGTGPHSAVSDGLDWVINRRLARMDVPAVINMSLDFRTILSDATVRQKITQALDLGVFVVVSTGNESSGSGPVVDTCSGLTWASDYVVGRIFLVGSASTSGIGSSRRAGACVDAYAPIARGVYGNSFGGSSSAAPQFAGIAALVLEEYPTATTGLLQMHLGQRATWNKIPNTASWPAGSLNRLAQSLPDYTHGE
jgi:subtilisin family serine protease